MNVLVIATGVCLGTLATIGIVFVVEYVMDKIKND
jgi:hypothetical protein